MKKIFSIILYVLLGIIILPILYLVFVLLLDTFYEAGRYSSINVYISTALSIPLSIIIPIRRYKRGIKNKDQKNKDINITLIIIVPILTLGLLMWFFWEDDPVKYEAPKTTSKPKTTSIYDQRYNKCYTEMTVAHSKRGLLKSNIELSVKVRNTVCKAYAKGEELNYEGKR